MIDEAGYRANVGIIVSNHKKQVFWGHRIGHDLKTGWQFPQGGIHEGEEVVDAMYRELHEEVGLERSDVQILGHLPDWLTYEFGTVKQTASGDKYIGQKQRWFLLRLLSVDAKICLNHGHQQEFDAWEWVDYWYPLEHVVSFKRDVYQHALKALFPYL